MGSLFKKPVYQTERIPVVDAKGKPVLDRNGRPKFRTVTVKNRKGKSVRIGKSEKWWIRYRDANGVLQRVPGFKDKAASLQKLADLEREVELQKAGISDPFQKHRKRALKDHLEDFRKSLADKGTTEDHVKLVTSRATRVVKECGFAFYDDISASRVQSFLADLKGKDIGAQTRNFYLQAIKQFCRWMVKDRRAGDNPVAHLTSENVKTDRRHDRCPLTDDQFAKLMQVTPSRGPICGISGEDRAMLYRLAAFTGFRASELASLTPESFDITAETPTLTVKAAYSKHRDTDTIPIHPDVLERVRVWLKTKPAGEPVWPGSWAENKQAGQMLKADLEAAGISYQDEATGRFRDFHSLRHTFGTLLGRSGVPLTTAQKLMRHCDPKLTANIYTHLHVIDQAAAIASLPSIDTTDGPKIVSAKATGTDGPVRPGGDGAQDGAFQDAPSTTPDAPIEKMGKIPPEKSEAGGIEISACREGLSDRAGVDGNRTHLTRETHVTPVLKTGAVTRAAYTPEFGDSN